MPPSGSSILIDRSTRTKREGEAFAKLTPTHLVPLFIYGICGVPKSIVDGSLLPKLTLNCASINASA